MPGWGRIRRLVAVAVGAAMTGVLAAAVPAAAQPGPGSFLAGLSSNVTVASTVPGNGDVNPYGVAVVPITRGALVAGEVLVSNFNNAPTSAAPGGLQGRGTTVVEVSSRGQQRLFAQIPATLMPGGVGLTTALVVLRSGWVIVGSLPTTDGTAATATNGGLIVLDSTGKVRETITGHGLDGPWDATALDLGPFAEVFVSTVLTGITHGQPATTHQGSVVRLLLDLSGDQPRVLDSTVIANDLAVHTDPAQLIVGPTGVALGPAGDLFVADTVNSRIARVPGAVFRSTAVDAGAAAATVSADPRLNGPLGLTRAPNGNLLTVNGGDNNVVELTTSGTVVATRNLDPGDPPDALFGLATTAYPPAVYYINDNTNTLNILH